MLFIGKGCFSPSVPPSLRKAWVSNGGSITQCAKDFREASFFFCSGLEDPWLPELLSRSLVVRHFGWISECIKEQFLMPVAPYTLDDHFDPSHMESRTVTSHETRVSLSQCGTNMSDPLSQLRRTHFLDSVILPDHNKSKNPLKRSFSQAHEDESYFERESRILKKARTRASGSSISKSYCLEKDEAPTRNTKRAIDYRTIFPATRELSTLINPMISTVCFQRTSADAMFPIKPPHVQLPVLDLLVRKEDIPASNQPKRSRIKPAPSSASSETDDSRPTKLCRHIRGLATHNVNFWAETRKAYPGCGPLFLPLGDILQSSSENVRARIFTSNGSYLGENFGCRFI